MVLLAIIIQKWINYKKNYFFSCLHTETFRFHRYSNFWHSAHSCYQFDLSAAHSLLPTVVSNSLVKVPAVVFLLARTWIGDHNFPGKQNTWWWHLLESLDSYSVISYFLPPLNFLGELLVNLRLWSWKFVYLCSLVKGGVISGAQNLPRWIQRHLCCRPEELGSCLCN